MPTQLIRDLRQALNQAVVGKGNVIDLVICALLARGHVLIEDAPGLGKTTLARSLAKSIGGDFSRIQFTPDLMPSDIVGTSMYHQPSGEFRWRPGPIFANVVLADELNRATPRAQSALLEAMSERQVTSDGETRMLADPFLVIATQNPIEHAGTYALPDSQLDRFMMRISMGYPARERESELLLRADNRDTSASMKPVVSPDQIRQAQSACDRVHLDPSIADYILDIVEETRSSRSLVQGVSPRGAVALVHCSKARALMHGRDFVTPDDVKSLAPAVFSHRVMERASERATADEDDSTVIESILERVVVPV